MSTATLTEPATEQSKSEALEELLRILPSRRQEMIDNQQQPADVVELFRKAGIYRALVAKRFGGDEVSPADFLRLIERISAVDASSGRVASFGFSAIYLAALPVTTLEKMYANGPDVIFAGGIFPPQPAVPVDGGLKVNGRWSWGSGSTGADVIGVGIKVEGGSPNGGLPRIAVMPSSSVTIDKSNWNVNGMRGTGSHDMVVKDIVVPEEWTFVRGGASNLTDPLYQYPSMALAAQVLAVVALGAARGALDDLIEMAGGRTSITGAPVLADRAFVQTEIAKAEASVRSAKAFFYEATEQAYDTLCKGDKLSDEARVMLRLSASHAAKAGSEACLSVYNISGTTGIFTDSTIGQRLQDSLVVPQHAFLSEGTFMSAGRCILGLDPLPGYP